MIKVYVAGAYTANNVISVLKNIGRGEAEAAKLFMAGYAVFTPWHDKDFIIKNPEFNFNVQRFLDYSMEWLRVSDAVYIVPNLLGLTKWSESKGTLAEIEEANRLGIPVVFSMDELQKRFPVSNTYEFG